MICCAWSDSALRATGSVVVSVWLYSSSNVHFPEASRAQYPLSLSSVTIPWHVWTMKNSDVSVIGVWTPITDTSLFLIVQTCHGIGTLDNDNGYCARDGGEWTVDRPYNQTVAPTDPC